MTPTDPTHPALRADGYRSRAARGALASSVVSTLALGLAMGAGLAMAQPSPLPLAPGAAGARGLDADGLTVLAGAPGDDALFTDAGAAVFTEFGPSGQIVGQAVLRSVFAERGGKFGWAVSLGEGVAAIGAPSDLAPGRAEVYQNQAGAWTRVGGAAGALPGDQFGYSVAVASGRVFAGVPGGDSGGSGSGRVVEVGAGEDAVLPLPTPAQLVTTDRYGHSIAAGPVGGVGLVVVGGAPLHNAGATDSGAVFVTAEGPSGWDAPVRLSPPSPATRAHFGSAVAIADGRVFVGSPHQGAGRVDVFERVGGAWTPVAALFSPNPMTGGRFGGAIDARGDRVIIGADREAGVSGRAYVFERVGGSWVLDRTIAPDEPVEPGATGRESSFATSVALTESVALVGAPALLEAALTNPAPARDALRAAREQRVEMVLFGDSNANFNGFGWAAGLPDALRRRTDLRCFASGLFSPNVNGGLGAGLGDLERDVNSGLPFGSLTGAPADLDRFLPSGSQFFSLHAGGWLDEGQSYSAFNNSGLALFAGHPLEITGRLVFRYRYGSFRDGVVSGTNDYSFSPLLRAGEAPFQQYQWEVVSTLDPVQAEPFEMRVGELVLEPGPRTGSINARLTRPSSNNAGGRVFISWFRVLNDERNDGWGFTTRAWEAGRGLRVFLNKFRAYETAAHTHFFDEVRHAAIEKGQSSRVLIVTSSGHNDRNDTEPALGLSDAIGNTQAGYLSNLGAFVGEIGGVWDANGWDQNELAHLLIPSHAVLGDVGRFGESTLVAFRRGAQDLALTDSRVTSFDNSWLIDFLWISGLGYYDPLGFEHLTSDGYRDLSAMVVDALLAPDTPARAGAFVRVSIESSSCVADWDGDGSVSIFDILAFLSDFGKADPVTDLTGEGVVNIFDVLEFLVRFESGCP